MQKQQNVFFILKMKINRILSEAGGSRKDT